MVDAGGEGKGESGEEYAGKEWRSYSKVERRGEKGVEYAGKEWRTCKVEGE